MTVTIITQEEVIVRGSIVAYVLHYDASISDVTQQPKAYDESFINTFKSKLSQKSASGEAYSLIRVSSTLTVSKTAAFSFFITGVIAHSQREAVVNAMAKAEQTHRSSGRIRLGSLLTK